MQSADKGNRMRSGSLQNAKYSGSNSVIQPGKLGSFPLFYLLQPKSCSYSLKQQTCKTIITSLALDVSCSELAPF